MRGTRSEPMESRVPHHIPGVSSSIMVQPLLDSRVPYGRLQHPLTIYPIDQMKSSHMENDYIDSPAAVCQQPQHTQPKHPAAGRQADANPHHQHQHHHHHHHHHHPHPHMQDSTHPWISFSGRPSSISSSSSTSSDQRLLDHAAPTPVLDSASTTISSNSTSSSSSSLPPAAASLGRVPGSGTVGLQAKLPSAKPADLKTPAGSGPDGPVGSPLPAEAKHLLLCGRCGKCRCTECTLPRVLPSCWVCHQACLCSAQSLVDAATCMCLVKGVFYHCAEDEDDGEEGSCADRPCSCAPAHRCARWSFMAALSLALPCLLCYLPAVGCAKLSQKCYDGAQRPGCRCKVAAVSKAGVAGILGKAGGGLDKQTS
ncbi:protein sprouty homolog 4 [Clupea harengus]|uniref:Protein sprouty homolog 4 n=1 Tax=Clupea harengus TaxID=7950 RepID=A0A6P3W9Q4_CLUHA|nr:protein sprouty homolog 4 [Clupea harengus]